MIADDRVDVYKQDELTLVGEPPKILQHLIVDPRDRDHRCHESFWCQCRTRIYAGSSSGVFRSLAKDKKYDRLGTDDTTVEIGGVDVPQIKIRKNGSKCCDYYRSCCHEFPGENDGLRCNEDFENRLTQLIEENSGN